MAGVDCLTPAQWSWDAKRLLVVTKLSAPEQNRLAVVQPESQLVRLLPQVGHHKLDSSHPGFPGHGLPDFFGRW